MFHNRVAIANETQYQIADVSPPLEAGTYAVWAEADAFIMVSKDAGFLAAVTATNGYPVYAKTIARVAVQTGEMIGASAAVSAMRVGA